MGIIDAVLKAAGKGGVWIIQKVLGGNVQKD
jgi:hypothetical protein